MIVGQPPFCDEEPMGQNTLETSGKDCKIHSIGLEKIVNYTRNRWRRSLGIYQKILAGKIYFPKYFDKV
jgi:hypothetical protein